MKRSMFARLVTVSIVIILTFATVLLGVFYSYSRQNAINRSVNQLKSQGRDLAYLAGTAQYDVLTGTLGYNSVTRKYIEWKAQNLYNQFNAYCIVIDRWGKGLVYIDRSLLNDEDIIATLNSTELVETMNAVLQGQEVELQTSTENGTMFTVAIPWMQSDRIQGAVVIQTASQTIRAAYTGMLIPLLAATVIAIIVAVLLIFLLTRQIVRPLTQMELSANAMAEGNFSIRAQELGSRETRSLARSFNGMAVQLEELETSRRDFVANVSHELRSPITSIQGYMQSMLDGTIRPEDQPRYMQVVLDETRRLSKLISSLLNLSRIEREDAVPAYTVFDINELTRRVLITKLTQIEEKEIEIIADFETDPCFVRADNDQITQVLVNLLDNAIKFSFERGKITVSSRVEKQTVFVRVADDGEGILPEDAAHIFDRFYTADKAHTGGKGTGLGLAICKRILEKHGQKIYTVASPAGAAFEFTLEKGEALPASPTAEQDEA
ncbi:MAG: HAMP domain-containing protein [Clostridia bacterium]|nr:HAMP domain-containing protein [Clostridia bacterium]